MRRTEMMRLSAVVALGAILAHTFVFANYTIVHRRTFNLNATFAGAEAIGDVAFDGNNLYVSSWHNTAGTQTVRLVQVGDIGTLLNTPSGALTPAGWTVTVSATGARAIRGWLITTITSTGAWDWAQLQAQPSAASAQQAV
jgi:hypothetical protein